MEPPRSVNEIAGSTDYPLSKMSRTGRIASWLSYAAFTVWPSQATRLESVSLDGDANVDTRTRHCYHTRGRTGKRLRILCTDHRPMCPSSAARAPVPVRGRTSLNTLQRTTIAIYAHSPAKFRIRNNPGSRPSREDRHTLCLGDCASFEAGATRPSVTMRTAGSNTRQIVPATGAGRKPPCLHHWN